MGNAVIITLPLGCLKAGDITFQPALPEWKTDAIAKLGNGNLNKVEEWSRLHAHTVTQRGTLLQNTRERSRHLGTTV